MAETTQLTLIRHGETTMIADNRIHGHLDAPLSELGMRDARKTAAYFRGQTFDVLYASSLGRAMTTAGIIGEAIHLNPIPVDGLRERYYGLLEGKSLDLFEPDGSGPWYMRPYVYLALGLTGESEEHVARRAVRSIEELLAKHRGERIIVCGPLGHPGSPFAILSRAKIFMRGERLGPGRPAALRNSMRTVEVGKQSASTTAAI